MTQHTTVSTEHGIHPVTLELTEDDLVVAQCCDQPGLVTLGPSNESALAKLKAALLQEAATTE